MMRVNGRGLRSNRIERAREGLSGQNFLVLNFRANWPCKITLNYRVVLQTSRWRACVYTTQVLDARPRAACAQFG